MDCNQMLDMIEPYNSPFIKEDIDNIETIFMDAKERKEKHLSVQKSLDRETLLEINKQLNNSNNLYIIWDSPLPEYCINFLKEKGYLVSKKFDRNCFYYKISFDI